MGQLDAGYRTLFSHPYLVESLISGFLPEQWTEGLDYSSLETVSEAHATETWSMRYNDRVWRLRKRAGGWIYFYLMLEFQSTNEHFMALRTLSYVGVLYQHLRKSLELRPRDLLPTVLPLVLYHGASRWTATTQVFDLIEPAGPGLAEFLPHLRYYLVDVHRMSLADLIAMRTAAACLFRLEASPSLDSSRIAINDLDTILDRRSHSALRHDFARWLSEILLPSRLPGVTVPEVRQLEEVRDMLTEHTIDWTAEWRMKGLEEGRRVGRREGELALVSRQLERKFGPLTTAMRRRVERAKSGQILRWSERLLTADSLAEVFDDS